MSDLPEIDALLARIAGLTRHPYMGGAGAQMQEALDDAAAALRALRAEVERLRDRSYALAVAITGGEDVPGYADSIATDVLVQLVRDNLRLYQNAEYRALFDLSAAKAEVERQSAVIADLTRERDAARDALEEARLQLQYLDEAGPSRGTTTAVIARISAALSPTTKGGADA